MKILDDDVNRLQTIMVDEQRRQAEELSTRLLANGIDVGNLSSLGVMPDDIGGGGGDDKIAVLTQQKNKVGTPAAACNSRVTVV